MNPFMPNEKYTFPYYFFPLTHITKSSDLACLCLRAGIQTHSCIEIEKSTLTFSHSKKHKDSGVCAWCNVCQTQYGFP